jgi:quercetin dioxygenase-like cupin family protein
MSDGYEILSLDDLERYPSEFHDFSVLMPLRRRLGLRAFGANCWTAEAGEQIVPRHEEDSGNEELYVVVRGRVRFLVGEEETDAPAGTLVHVPSGVVRQAFAEEPESIVLVVGGTIGEAFTVYDWETTPIAFTSGRLGKVEEGRAVLRSFIESHPDAWWGPYNAACYETRYSGDADAAFTWLAKARELAADDVRNLAVGDPDLEPLHADPRWQEVVA